MNDSQELSRLAEMDNEDASPEREAATKRSTWVSVVVNIGLTISLS